MAHHIVDSVLQLTSAISLSVAALLLDIEKAFDRAVREAVLGYESHIGSDPISRRAHIDNVGFPPVVVREILRMNKADLHYSKSGECQPKRRASLLRCTVDPGSVVVNVHQSLKHVKAADKGACWGAQPSTSFMLKLSCDYTTSSIMRGAS